MNIQEIADTLDDVYLPIKSGLFGDAATIIREYIYIKEYFKKHAPMEYQAYLNKGVEIEQ